MPLAHPIQCNQLLQCATKQFPIVIQMPIVTELPLNALQIPYYPTTLFVYLMISVYKTHLVKEASVLE